MVVSGCTAKERNRLEKLYDPVAVAVTLVPHAGRPWLPSEESEGAALGGQPLFRGPAMSGPFKALWRKVCSGDSGLSRASGLSRLVLQAEHVTGSRSLLTRPC